MLACVCAIDRAALPALMEYWVPEVDVTGLHELVANALILPGEQERTTDLRGSRCREWRKVVRDGVTEFVNADGKTYHMSLSNTCLDCHSNKEPEFCDQCHDYASVKPYCWDCHIENPKGDK
jgi:hypothetical protein